MSQFGFPVRDSIRLSMLLQSGDKWIQLENPNGGYELHTDTFGQRQVTHRKVEVESEWIEGSYTQRSLRANVMETVSVWVTGASSGEMMKRVRAITDTLDQPSFRIYWEVDGYKEVWICQSSDYVIESSQPMLFARKVLVKATIPRLPKVVT